MFVPIKFDCILPYENIHTKFSRGLSNDTEYQMQLLMYGPCNIEVPTKSIPQLLVEEVLNPFYVF
jgi:cation-transporting ATPase 13A2